MSARAAIGLAAVALCAAPGCNTPRYEPVLDALPPVADGSRVAPPPDSGVPTATSMNEDAAPAANPDGAPAADAGPAMMPVPTCEPGTRMCPGRGCLANDTSACGSGCQRCEAPAQGSVTCDGTRCLPMCPAGSVLCGPTCQSLANDGCCLTPDCRMRTSATASCQSNKCVFACNAGTFDCAGACEDATRPTCCGSEPGLDSNGNNTPDCRESLIPGGQFGKGLGPWKLRDGFDDVGAADWSTLDARGGSSGSARVTVKDSVSAGGQAVALDSPCFPARPDETYNITYDAYIPSGADAPDYTMASVESFDDTECGGARTGLFDGDQGIDFRRWMRLGVRFIVPARTQSFRISLWAQRLARTGTFAVHFDNVIVRP